MTKQTTYAGRLPPLSASEPMNMGVMPWKTMYVVIVRFICELVTSKSFAMTVRAGKYICAVRGEKKAVRAAARTMARFCHVVKTE